MTNNPDAFWDDLGIAWQAAEPNIGLIAPRLRGRLRRQSFFITAGMAVGLLLAVAGAALGAFTLWSGWTNGAWNFIPRGIGIVAIAAMLALAVTSVNPVRVSDNAKSLSDMIDLAVARSERTLRIIRLGLYGCAIATVLGLIGTAIRTYFAHPPAMSPLLDLGILGAVALGLWLCGIRVRTQLAKFEYLARAFDEGDQ